MSTSPRGGGDKCTVCGKTVYFAERKEHEKQLFHVVCFNKWWKERTSTGEGLWGGKYNSGADVQPAYYRTSDNSGAGPKMESGSEYKARSSSFLTGSWRAPPGPRPPWDFFPPSPPLSPPFPPPSPFFSLEFPELTHFMLRLVLPLLVASSAATAVLLPRAPSSARTAALLLSKARLKIPRPSFPYMMD